MAHCLHLIFHSVNAIDIASQQSAIDTFVSLCLLKEIPQLRSLVMNKLNMRSYMMLPSVDKQQQMSNPPIYLSE